jgi:hypothetical protein
VLILPPVGLAFPGIGTRGGPLWVAHWRGSPGELLDPLCLRARVAGSMSQDEGKGSHCHCEDKDEEQEGEREGVRGGLQGGIVCEHGLPDLIERDGRGAFEGLGE